VGTVSIAFVNLGGTNFNPFWRVIAPDGTVVTTCNFSSSALRTCTLPAAGAYAVEVLDGSSDGTGRYRLTVSGAACRGLPNLAVSSISCGASTFPGGSITVNVRTANIGDAAAPASTTGVYLSLNNTFGGDTALLPKVAVPALAAGASAAVPVTVTIPAATAVGKDFILAQADDAHSVPEGNEMNNVAACPLTVGPDLVVSSIVAPAAAARGAAIVAAVTVRNTGGATSAATTMRLHFSTDNVASAGDVAANVAVGALGPNATATVNATITIPSTTPVGTRFLIAVADVLGIVREADERNNSVTRSIVIQ
jgi:subtilase family serine protease